MLCPKQNNFEAPTQGEHSDEAVVGSEACSCHDDSSEHRVSRQIDQDQILPCEVPASPCHSSLMGKMGIIVSFLAGQWSDLHKTVAKLTVTEYWLY